MIRWFFLELNQPRVVGDSSDQASSFLHTMNKQIMETTEFSYFYTAYLTTEAGLIRNAENCKLHFVFSC